MKDEKGVTFLERFVQYVLLDEESIEYKSVAKEVEVFNEARQKAQEKKRELLKVKKGKKEVDEGPEQKRRREAYEAKLKKTAEDGEAEEEKDTQGKGGAPDDLLFASDSDADDTQLSPAQQEAADKDKASKSSKQSKAGVGAAGAGGTGRKPTT